MPDFAICHGRNDELQRPHAPIAPAAEHFGIYDPEQIELPASSADYCSYHEQRNRLKE
jgi:hypothetical protein